MRFKNLLLSLVFFIAKPAFAWLHINELKPHLAVSPEHPTVTFYWNGDSPELDEKDAVLDGKFSEASDAELMEALLKAAMDKWNDVETAYINMVVQQNASVEIDPDDETFSIVVADQVSKAVAASAQPSFLTQDPNPSDLEKNPHIIHDCDISVSTAKVSAQSLLRTLVHELGHCLGLGHPHSNYLSIMSYAAQGSSAELALDDKAAVSFLYPEPGQSQSVRNLTTCGSLGGASPPSSLGLFLLPLLALCWRRFSHKWSISIHSRK